MDHEDGEVGMVKFHKEKGSGNPDRLRGQGEYNQNQGRYKGRDIGLSSIKVTLPIFKGGSDLEAYLNWEL